MIHCNVTLEPCYNHIISYMFITSDPQDKGIAKTKEFKDKDHTFYEKYLDYYSDHDYIKAALLYKAT